MRQSQSLNVAEALSMTALDSLRAALVRSDKVGRHQFILSNVATVVALALAHEPPKGFGNAGDHAKLVSLFTDAKLKAYAEHAVAIKVALKGRMRSCASWEEALTEGAAISAAAFVGCAPKVRTTEQEAAAQAKREERKAEKAQEAAEQASKDAADASSAQAAMVAEAIRAEHIAQAIRAGMYSTADMVQLVDALRDAGVIAAAEEGSELVTVTAP